jgi:hypothetical protein
VTGSVQPTTHVAPAPQQVALVDLLDRLLGTGVVLSGDITISLSGIDLVHVRLYALLASVGAGLLGEDR